MRWPFAPSRSRARATTACTSALPALTAESSSKAAPVTEAIRRATVVLPVPGGPYRITEPSRSSSIVRRSGAPGPSRCSWPATSSSVRGRRRSASGAPEARARPAASAKRSSTPPMLPACRRPTMCSMDGALRDEATKLLADLIRIDTSNPPGHETPAAVFLQWFLEREGIACELIAKDPERANLVARIKGSGEGPSLTLLGHTDVVSGRSRAPGASIRSRASCEDGYVWGRGALDMKCHTVCNVLAFALIARSGIRPRGDLVLIAEADEEEGTTGVGLPFVVAQRPDLRTDYALNESSERLVLSDGRVVHLFGTAEKATMPVRVTARGRPGPRVLARRRATTRS